MRNISTYHRSQPVDLDVCPDDLVPLALAVTIVEERLFIDDLGNRPSRLTGIAHALAALVPVYSYSVDASNIRRMTDRELLFGLFRYGGAELHFLDGRPKITNMAVAENRIAEVIGLLLSAPEPENNANPKARTMADSEMSASR